MKRKDVWYADNSSKHSDRNDWDKLGEDIVIGKNAKETLVSDLLFIFGEPQVVAGTQSGMIIHVDRSDHGDIDNGVTILEGE
jgi:hypothetical protein